MGEKSDFVVIVAPCPVAIPAVEGWMSRIHMVDTIFASSRRVYIDPISGVYGFEDAKEKKHNRLVSEYRVDLQIPQHRKLVEDLILRARLVYIHTCHLARYFLPYYATGKIITDIHGIVPEEEELQLRPDHALFYEGVERIVLTNSRKLVVVTEAMKQHLLQKHPDSHAEFLVMPIIESHPQDYKSRKKRQEGARYRAIYSGGIQAWQNIEATVDLCKKAHDFCDFKFLSHEHARIKAMFDGHAVSNTGQFLVSAKKDLYAHYLEADFGLVLRQDIAVNRVSCPTKLSEYLWFGIIPVVRSAAIGDFDAGGYCYINEEEFAAGLIPDEHQLEAMRQKNWELINKLSGLFSEVSKRLEGLTLKNGIHGNSFYGLPIGNDSLVYPGYAELYVIGEQTTHHKSTVIGPYNRMAFEVQPQVAKCVRFVPYLERIGVRIRSLKISGNRKNGTKAVVERLLTLGKVSSSWIFLDRSTPFIDVYLSADFEVTNVEFQVEFCPASIEDVKAEVACEHVVDTTVGSGLFSSKARVRIQSP